MRALLVNPWIHDFSAFDLWSKPLGLLQIAAYLKKTDVEISFIDCLDRFHPDLKNFLKGKIPHTTEGGSGNYYTEEIELPEVLKNIPRIYKRYGLPRKLFEALIEKEPKPEVILVSSGMTYWYPGVFEAIKILKKRFDSVPLILGGIYPKLCLDHARKYSGADVVYPGNDLAEIGRLAGELTGKEINNNYYSKQEYIPPAYELYSDLKYITLRTSSGCPFKCTYCAWYILEPEFRQYPPEVIINQIEYFYKSRGLKNFAFYDEALLFNAQNHLVVILKEIMARNIKANFHTPNGLHIKYITPEIACLLKKTGFVQPRLGLETTSIKKQRETGAKTTTAEFITAVGYLKQAGFNPADIGVNILIGLPGQNIGELETSIEFIASVGCRIFLEQYSPIPQTTEFARSGLKADADPLLHNKSIFALFNSEEKVKLQKIKDHAHQLNKIL